MMKKLCPTHLSIGDISRAFCVGILVMTSSMLLGSCVSSSHPSDMSSMTTSSASSSNLINPNRNQVATLNSASTNMRSDNRSSNSNTNQSSSMVENKDFNEDQIAVNKSRDVLDNSPNNLNNHSVNTMEQSSMPSSSTMMTTTHDDHLAMSAPQQPLSTSDNQREMMVQPLATSPHQSSVPLTNGDATQKTVTIPDTSSYAPMTYNNPPLPPNRHLNDDNPSSYHSSIPPMPSTNLNPTDSDQLMPSVPMMNQSSPSQMVTPMSADQRKDGNQDNLWQPNNGPIIDGDHDADTNEATQKASY